MATNRKHRAHKRDSIQAKRIGIGRDARHRIRTVDRAHTAAIEDDKKRRA